MTFDLAVEANAKSKTVSLLMKSEMLIRNPSTGTESGGVGVMLPEEHLSIRLVANTTSPSAHSGTEEI